jgi:hypothetical protein
MDIHGTESGTKMFSVGQVGCALQFIVWPKLLGSNLENSYVNGTVFRDPKDDFMPAHCMLFRKPWFSSLAMIIELVFLVLDRVLMRRRSVVTP